MKKFINLCLLSVIISLPSSSQATENLSFSGNAALVSQYLFRGFDLSQEDPALQGGFDIEHQSGFSAGIWGSNYDVGADDGAEIDLYAAWGFQLSDKVTLSVGVTEYTYTGDTDSSTEFNLGLSVEDFSAIYFYDNDLKTDYYQLGYSFALSDATSLDLHYGHYAFDDGSDSNDLGLTLHYALNKTFTLDVGATSIDVNGLDDYVWAGISAQF